MTGWRRLPLELGERGQPARIGEVPCLEQRIGASHREHVVRACEIDHRAQQSERVITRRACDAEPLDDRVGNRLAPVGAVAL